MKTSLENQSSFKPGFRNAELGLYVHIPFCLKKCHYCDFVITTKRDSASRARFFDALRSEIKQAAGKYGRLKLDTCYLGGGTPSALEASEFAALIRMLREAFDFNSGFEFTVEVNPGDIDASKISAYHAAGVNRISLGVQAFQDSLLQAMNRPHGTAEIQTTVQFLREAGISNLSFDMILNLPGQSVRDVQDTVQRLIELQPGQISVYDLDVHEKTVYGRRRREGLLNLADEEEHARMAEMTAQTLEKAGFGQYELSNFARPGFESKHNLLYWHNRAYLGLGPGAFSYMGGIRYQYADSVESYLQKAEAGNWKNQTEDQLTDREIEKETFLTGIRLKEGIDLRRVPLLAAGLESAAAEALKEGLLEKDGFRLKFTERGKRVAEIILRAFAQI